MTNTDPDMPNRVFYSVSPTKSDTLDMIYVKNPTGIEVYENSCDVTGALDMIYVKNMTMETNKC